jgi:hypothetical protein
VRKAITTTYNMSFLGLAAQYTKLTRIIATKQVPTLERYVISLSRKQASAIFRLRSMSTRAEANMCGRSALPICPRCNDGLATDEHYFTTCSGTEEERRLYGITCLRELFACNPDISVLGRYADFAIAIGLVINA